MKSKSLALSAMFAFCALVSSAALAANWAYTITSGTPPAATTGTISDGVWTFNAAVAKNTSNLTVKEPVDGAPTALTDLDFSKKVVKSDDETVEYTIVELACAFNNHSDLKVLVGKLTLPGEGLTTVSGNAFNGCTVMTGDIRFPSTITSVGGNAFAGSKITSIYMEPTAARCKLGGGYGGGGAFANCTSMTNLTIAAGGDVEFETGAVVDTCTKLKKADLSGVTCMKMWTNGAVTKDLDNGYGNFDACSALEEIILGEGLTNMAPVSLFGNSGTSLKTVRFLGPPPTTFGTPYLYGISKTQKVTTVVPLAHIDEWKPYAADQTISTLGTTWASNYLVSGTDVANRPMILDQSTGEEAPVIQSVGHVAYGNAPTEAKITVEGVNLNSGTIAIVISNATAEVTRKENLTDFGTFAFTELEAGTSYSAYVSAVNKNGSTTTNLTFKTFSIAVQKTAQVFYDPTAKVFALYYDLIDRSGVDGCPCYSITGASTWGKDKTIRNATQVVIDSSFIDYKPTSCQEWFADFSYVNEIVGIEYLDVSQATSIYGLFRGTAIISIDISRFKTSLVTNFGHLFRACAQLTTIYANENFSLAAMTSDTHTFLNNNNLVGGSGTKYNGTSKTSSEYARVDDPDNDKPGYFTYKAPPAVKPSITSASVQAVSNDVATVCVYGNDLQGGTITIELWTGGAAVKSQEVDAWGDYAFSGLTRATEYTVKISATNTAGTTTDDSLVFSTWGTTTLAARAVFTAHDARLVFYYDDVDRSGSDATVYAFNAKCENTWGDALSQVRYIVFDSSFKGFRPISCANWFSYCQGKGSNGIYFRGWENLNTSQVTSMARMFYFCKTLENPDLSHFDTRKVTNFSEFTVYGGWDPLDVSSFDTRSATDMSNMFQGCTTIYANERFVTTKVTKSTNMFLSSKIVGGAGTAYSSEHASDITYARVDDPDNGNPGYFTYKAPPSSGGLMIFLR